MPTRATGKSDRERQLSLQFGPIRNNHLLSTHWLERRLPLEPEWSELQDSGREAVRQLLELWKVERERVEKYGDEAGLEEKFIQPVLAILGWSLKYQPFLDGREPDYALFASEKQLEQALDAGRKSPDFWASATVVADAKAWHISLDRPTRVKGKREYPPEQIEWYLDRSRLDYGILTNGRLWRIIPRSLGRNQPRFQTYLEVDLLSLLDAVSRPSAQLQLEPEGSEFQTFLHFFLIFGVHGYRSIKNRKPLIRRAIEGSSEYALGVSEELKERVFEALRLTVEGFLSFAPNHLDPHSDLEICQEHSLVLLYRLLFIMYSEDRGLLPYRTNEVYTRNRSLARHRDEVATKLDNLRSGVDHDDYAQDETRIWSDLQGLFDLIDRGHGRYGVPAYNGGLFNLEAEEFLARNAVPDWYLARILDHLGRARLGTRGDESLVRVDYRDLAIRQLGSVYEGLLELTPRYADKPMKVVRRKSPASHDELVISAQERIPKNFELTGVRYESGTIYLATDKGERRSTGSYYTPDHIVDHMVEAALGPICERITQDIAQRTKDCQEAAKNTKGANRDALNTELEGLLVSFDDRVLELKVLDPAMGSGHFLIRACQFLAEEIATNPYSSDPASESMEGDESTITYWKRKVAESCLFGVDLNPMAVELAKLAIWLETVAADAPLTFLDHHFRYGDSIIGARIDWLNSLPGEEGLLEGQFQEEVKSALSSILDPLAEIDAIPSDTADQVKQKERIFRRRFSPALERFTLTADLWCASLLNTERVLVSKRQYSKLLESLRTPKRFHETTEESWAQGCLDFLESNHIRCTHYELTFPQVFLTALVNGGGSGFDVVIGNPPYDVLSEREIGSHAKFLKGFVEGNASLAPSRVGKNNLYKIFICRALELLRKDGVLSFIVPMPLLGDAQAAGVRRVLLDNGSFEEIHAFPQKDDAKRRVFLDAKLSTSLFVYRKGEPKEPFKQFISSVHPAQYIGSDSPSLRLASTDIDLYDPVNLTIVSCSQADWDLATRILKNTGIGRLGRYCKSYQGEVNETTDRRFLLDHDGRGRSLVLRGSNVCLYVLRGASQGEPLYIDIDAFRKGKHPDSKAYHGLVERIGFQRSSPQNNFRRIIAAHIPAGELCFDTISYVPIRANATMLPPGFLLALLNSKLADWFFRLGSTNSKVNEYQFNNLPCPVFREASVESESALTEEIKALIKSDPISLTRVLQTLWAEVPFHPVLRDVLGQLAMKIQALETSRGEISRHDRSHLCEGAQSYQDAIDLILFKMVGLTDGEITGIEARLAQML